ncbi:MAG TPA: Stp1/IreP family PP2C-type Ser/Thr phosphatase [Blastocatellia bacterium]|nr:Stp1/IreP family PP2C-type Ser/Thr phosphatase [Blastocatellia bacterium]
MSDVLVSVSARTDVGMQRSGNEDSFLVADLTTGADGEEMKEHPIGERGGLLIVSDGMGGAAAGEIASEMAVTTIKESLIEQADGANISERLKQATEEANERIWSLSQENAEMAGMGATVTAVVVRETVAHIAQVGDSRAYLIRNGQIRQLTKDQSLAQMLLDAGAIQPEQAHSVPQNVIMQALGTQPNIRVAMTELQLYRDDHLVLCSDGLSNKVEPEEMIDIIEDAEDLSSASEELIRLANERGGEDNITVIIARFDGEALRPASEGAVFADNASTLRQITLTDDIGDTTTFYAPTAYSSQQEAAKAAAAAPQAQDPQPADPPTPTESSEGDNYESSEAEWSRPTIRLTRKIGYTQIIVFAVISLILIAAAVYFFITFSRPGQQPIQKQIAPQEIPAQQTEPAQQPAEPQQQAPAQEQQPAQEEKPAQPEQPTSPQ